MAAAETPMQIDVIFDTVCPWCFIGKRRLEAALERAGEEEVQIVWHPFLLNPEMPIEGIDKAPGCDACASRLPSRG